MNSIIKNYQNDAVAAFRSYKKLAERALEQISDKEFFMSTGDEDNSIAILVKHIAGNQRSRFSGFLTTDGEKPDRFRDTEFVLEEETREQLMSKWEEGWAIVFDAVEPLEPADFAKRIKIRGEEHTVIEAISRQLAHCAYHIGQISFLAKHFRSSEWKTLSVPRNQSDEFNKFMSERQLKSKDHALEGPMDFAGGNSGENRE